MAVKIQTQVGGSLLQGILSRHLRQTQNHGRARKLDPRPQLSSRAAEQVDIAFRDTKADDSGLLSGHLPPLCRCIFTSRNVYIVANRIQNKSHQGVTSHAVSLRSVRYDTSSLAEHQLDSAFCATAQLRCERPLSFTVSTPRSTERIPTTTCEHNSRRQSPCSIFKGQQCPTRSISPQPTNAWKHY